MRQQTALGIGDDLGSSPSHLGVVRIAEQVAAGRAQRPAEHAEHRAVAVDQRLREDDHQLAETRPGTGSKRSHGARPGAAEIVAVAEG